MKKLMIIILSISVIFIYGCCECNERYTIQAPGIDPKYTDVYTKEGNCIKFVPNGYTDVITICGTYTITENKNWKPKKK